MTQSPAKGLNVGDMHPRHRLNDLIHAPVRLSLLAALAAVDKADFGALRDAVEITDSALSKQIATLEKAGYVRVSKGRVGRRPRTWLALTAQGHRALREHLAALSDITASRGPEPDPIALSTQPGGASGASAAQPTDPLRLGD